MIDRERRTTKLAVKRQAELLGIPRQSVYYKPRAQENAPAPSAALESTAGARKASQAQNKKKTEKS